MDRKIKRAAVLLLSFVLLICCPVAAAAETKQQSQQEILEEQLEISGANDLFEEIPEETEELLKKNGVDSLQPDKLMNLSVGGFFQNLWEMLKKELLLPLRILLATIAIVLLCSLFQTFRSTVEEKGYTQVFNVVSVLAACAAVLAPVVECISRAAESIRQCGNFILAFIPVFTGVVAASGKPITAAGYTTVMFGAVQAVSQIAASVLVPLLGIFLAFCIAGSLNSQINIGGIISTVKKVVVWTLGFLLTIFVGLLTIRGIVAGSADTVATKTTKFLLGSFVPVVGGALSEALNSVQGCMGVIRSSVGSLGIIVCVLTFLPLLLTILLLMGTLHLSAGVAELMSVEKVGGILKSAASVLSLIFGIILMFALLLVVSVTILLLIGMG